MWIRKRKLQELIDTSSLGAMYENERKLREAVSKITKEWDTKREELIQQVVDLKIEIKEDEKIKEELHKFNAPVEVIIESVGWCGEVLRDTRNEARDQIQDELGRKDIPETYPYETEPLEAGVTYKVSKDTWVGVVALKFLEGTGHFEERYGAFKGIKFTVNTRELYKVFNMGRIIPSQTKFIIKPLTEESKLKYTLIGTGFNNPKIEEVK